nr:hypothetical protein CFP56_32196 [Quercus suber]
MQCAAVHYTTVLPCTLLAAILLPGGDPPVDDRVLCLLLSRRAESWGGCWSPPCAGASACRFEREEISRNVGSWAAGRMTGTELDVQKDDGASPSGDQRVVLDAGGEMESGHTLPDLDRRRLPRSFCSPACWVHTAPDPRDRPYLTLAHPRQIGAGPSTVPPRPVSCLAHRDGTWVGRETSEGRCSSRRATDPKLRTGTGPYHERERPPPPHRPAISRPPPSGGVSRLVDAVLRPPSRPSARASLRFAATTHRIETAFWRGNLFDHSTQAHHDALTPLAVGRDRSAFALGLHSYLLPPFLAAKICPVA